MSLLFSPMKSIEEHAAVVPIFINGAKTERLDAAEQLRKELMADRDGIEGYVYEGKEDEEKAELSSRSSSIGVLSSSSSSSDEDEREDEAQSKLKDDDFLGSLTSLEESLPIKRGLSNFFTGKSKSFASLVEATSFNASDLVKPEKPFNKRRRVLVSCKATWRCKRR